MRPEGKTSPAGLSLQPKVHSAEHRANGFQIAAHLSTCQDPQNPRKRIYRVFSCIEDTTGTETETGHALRGSAKVSNNKAIRDSLATVLTNKAAMQTRDPMMQQLAIEDGNVEGVPKKRKTTKPPKECTEEQKKQKEFDSSMKKILFYITVRICLSQVLSFHDGTTTYIYIFAHHLYVASARIQHLATKARTAASKSIDKGIQHQEALLELVGLPQIKPRRIL